MLECCLHVHFIVVCDGVPGRCLIRVRTLPTTSSFSLIASIHVSLNLLLLVALHRKSRDDSWEWKRRRWNCNRTCLASDARIESGVNVTGCIYKRRSFRSRIEKRNWDVVAHAVSYPGMYTLSFYVIIRANGTYALAARSSREHVVDPDLKWLIITSSIPVNKMKRDSRNSNELLRVLGKKMSMVL